MRAIAITLVIMMSGCFGTDDTPAPSPGGEGPDTEGPAEDLRWEAPTWMVGDWWTYRFADGSQATWVVTEAGGGYMVDIDDEGMAFADAALSDISTIGPVTADLDGRQDETPVRFFDWPLTNKTWDMTWDGIAFTATATATTGGASIEAVGADGRFRTYTYDNASGWFGSMVAVDPNGTTEWTMDLTDAGSDYAGTYVRYTLHDPSFTTLAGAGRNTLGVLTVPAGATDIWTDASLACDPTLPGGQLTYQLVPPGPNQEGLSHHQRCPGTPYQETRVIAAHEGTWRDALTTTGVVGHIWVVPRTLDEYTL